MRVYLLLFFIMLGMWYYLIRVGNEAPSMPLIWHEQVRR